jgi:hypothetical protein
MLLLPVSVQLAASNLRRSFNNIGALQTLYNFRARMVSF